MSFLRQYTWCHQRSFQTKSHLPQKSAERREAGRGIPGTIWSGILRKSHPVIDYHLLSSSPSSLDPYLQSSSLPSTSFWQLTTASCLLDIPQQSRNKHHSSTVLYEYTNVRWVSNGQYYWWCQKMNNQHSWLSRCIRFPFANWLLPGMKSPERQGWVKGRSLGEDFRRTGLKKKMERLTPKESFLNKLQQDNVLGCVIFCLSQCQQEDVCHWTQ